MALTGSVLLGYSSIILSAFRELEYAVKVYAIMIGEAA
jgi:hypothetical protein